MIRLSVKRPVFVTMIMLAIASIGVFCYFQLPRQLFPDIDFPMVTVVTRYEGAGPEEMEQLITRDLEDEISTVEGVKHLRSFSQQGLSVILAEFYLGTDTDDAAADVRAKVNAVRSFLPEDADDPIVQKFDFNAQPILLLSVSADRSLRDIYLMTDQYIKDRVSSVPDVASVEILGGEEREINIFADQQRLRAYGLSIVDIVGAVSAANLESPGGHIQQNSREYNIRMRGKFTNLDEIRNLRVHSPGGPSVYLRDIAKVEDTFKEVRDKARSNGKACVGLSIKKRAGGNTVAVDKAVRREIENLRKTLPGDYIIRVETEEASWITSSITNVFQNMIIGIILTAIALFLFLHSFRGVLIITLTMPISVMATFIIMYLCGVTMNLMSLMGLAMTIGVLVNNAILVLENIDRYIHLGHDTRVAAVEGASEIAVAVSSTTLTNVVVFVPIAFMGGVIGQFFKDFGLAAVFATIVSLFVSFTLAPMMASRLLSKTVIEPTGIGLFSRFARGFDKQFDLLKQAYMRGLLWCLRHRFVALFIVMCVFFGSFFLAKHIGAEFITSMDQGRFLITVEMPTGTRLEETDEAIRQIEAVLSDRDAMPELTSYFSTIGRTSGGQIGGASQAVNIATTNVSLVDKSDRGVSTQEVMDRLRPIFAAVGVPGANIKLLESSGDGGAEAAIQMEITGDNMEHIKAFANQAIKIISDHEQVPGTVDVDTNYRLGQPEIRIVPDREKCLDHNVNTDYLAEVINASFEGLARSEYRDGAFEHDIRIRLSGKSRSTIADIENLTVMNRPGKLIPLPQLAEIVHATGPAQVFRKNRRSLITVTCGVSGHSSGDVASDIAKKMEPLLVEYPDCNIFFAGEIEHMTDTFTRMGIALIMAVSLTYMLLASLLESFVQPLIIMFTLPLSLIGVFVGLFLTGGTFSAFSVMSIVMLVGLVINNAIIVIDYINILRRDGKPRHEAVIEAGVTRLRPILMANLTTVVAMIPLALGIGFAGEMRAPMAMVQIGGLIAGGWMGLFIVPVIYTINEDFGVFLRRLLHMRAKKQFARNNNTDRD